ncbi:hypothetical protein [Herbiconiux daphne]|uniref:Portal protein n=1 Tax=Herbiconiux daphne TaxID=2970914 RepID=A0ABT2H9Q8_9MICO|nr:hypothetical protein [Herbiconiux daphne]MCS5736700.1 hypothetical protein [Herbiconiux daphne]
MYMIGCGYSPIFAQGQAGATEAQTLITKDNDQRTTKQLRRRFTEILSNLFAKLLVYKGYATDRESAFEMITIQIKENVVYNQLQLVDFLNNAISYGLMTKLQAIMIMNDTDNEDDAKQVLEEIEKDQQAQNQQIIEHQVAFNQATSESNPEGLGAMGNGGDADPILEP